VPSALQVVVGGVGTTTAVLAGQVNVQAVPKGMLPASSVVLQAQVGVPAVTGARVGRALVRHLKGAATMDIRQSSRQAMSSAVLGWLWSYIAIYDRPTPQGKLCLLEGGAAARAGQGRAGRSSNLSVDPAAW
jgi:hypothetical protein